jgi:hypothetical protein
MARKELLCPLDWEAQVSLKISSNEYSAHMAIEKIKILGAVFGATS